MAKTGSTTGNPIEDLPKSQWLVKVSELLSKSREIIVEADQMVIVDGVLTFVQNDKKLVDLSIAAGQWTAAYRIDVLNETPLAVVKWQGEITYQGFGEQTKKLRV